MATAISCGCQPWFCPWLLITLPSFVDVLVGAPYTSKDYQGSPNEGAVYVFNGGKSGLHVEPSQIITAGELMERHNISVKGFGFGLSGTKDLDRNGYNDVVAGAYMTSQAIVFRYLLLFLAPVPFNLIYFCLCAASVGFLRAIFSLKSQTANFFF